MATVQKTPDLEVAEVLLPVTVQAPLELNEKLETRLSKTMYLNRASQGAFKV